MKNPIYKDRIPEWINAATMLLASVQLLWLSSIETAEGFTLFIMLGIPIIIPIVLIGVVGLARLIALYINGRWRKTPLIRAVGAISGAMFFSVLFVGGYLPAIVFALVDIYAAYKAGEDVRLYGGDRH